MTISDFQFAASTVTVRVGETVTWTNDGPSSHTATASDGSFDTGLLKKGASASHTFTQAGTFTYFCQIHPFMHGTVVVLAAASAPAPSPPPGAGSPPSSSTRTPTPSPPAPTSGTTLPLTGMNVATGALLGFLFLGLGLALRRRVSGEKLGSGTGPPRWH